MISFLQKISVSFIDTFTALFVLSILGLLFYLSNKEIRRSLTQSRLAQNLLEEDRKVLKIRLEKSMRELEESRATRLEELSKAAEFGRLSQGLFHDLITPLTSVILHTEKLKHDESIERHLAKAVEASKRMAEYVRDIRTTLSQEECEQEFIIEEELLSVIHMFSYQIRGLNVEQRVVTRGATTWHGNPVKIRQVFSNLISNALDAFTELTDPRARLIEITLYKEGKDIICKVKDNGVGISKENIGKIYNPFFTTKTREKGTGIGLTTVKTIVEKDLKGTLEVESEEGVGSLFTITFPAQYKGLVSSHPLQYTPPRHA